MLLGAKRKWVFFCVNHLYKGTNERNWEKKRKLLNWIGHEIGEGTKVVGPITLYGVLHTGKNVWLGTDFTIQGLGHVYIGDNCDIAPSVMCLTGTHELGAEERRAGKGKNEDIIIGSGCWICARSTIIGGNRIGDGVVVASGATVTKNIPGNVMVGGVPAKICKELE